MERYQFPRMTQMSLEALPQPFAVYQNVNGQVVTLVLSSGFCELFGYENHAQAYDDMNRSVYGFIHPDDEERITNVGMRFVKEGGMYDVVYRTMNRKASRYQIIRAIGKFVYTEEGVRLGYVWYADEGWYTEEAQMGTDGFRAALNNALHEGSIVKAIQYDHLTGLPSMTHFLQLAEDFKKNLLKKGEEPVLLYLDLCGMKFFNSRNGFVEGDRLLQAFAGLLMQTFGAENCCRAGADHFGAVVGAEGLEAILERFVEDAKAINDGKTLPVHIGVYRNRMGEVTASVAYDRAKLACDRIKSAFDSGISYYDSSMKEQAELRQYILTHLDQALRERWIQVHYQPIVRALNGRVCDEEALARWYDPERGRLAPMEFIPILEEAGMNYKLDLYVLDRILEKLAYHRETGLTTVPHSLNLSRSDFNSCDIVEEIRRRVDEAGFSRELITIEITESTLARDFEFMKEQVNRFQRLGFQVWMDDFGSGYSSLDVLQSIHFNLIKFDMSFMQKLDESENGKIILTELMKMATSLGLDTVCEGVETLEQVHFLQEIGCSKLQGYYYSKPIPEEQIRERYRTGTQIGYEDPEASSYYEVVGRLNLFDPSVIASGEERVFHNFFNTLPMAIMEIKGDQARFARSNRSYREFMLRFFGFDLTDPDILYTDPLSGPGASFMRLVRQSCRNDIPVFIDEQLHDGSIVHSFARKIGTNPVTGETAAAVAVLSLRESGEGATYASIARALAADYYNLYYVDLQTERFIEYSSQAGNEDLAVERHGEDFFAAARRDTMTRIYKEDREAFLAKFTKEKILKALEETGVFTATYRLIDTGEPMYVNMKIMPMQPGSHHLIIGISVANRQMR